MCKFSPPCLDSANHDVLTARAGARCVFADPAKLAGIIRGTDLLLDRDPDGCRYIENCRTIQRRGALRMPELSPLDLNLTVDQVLRAQGADPARLRERSPRLVEIAEQALVAGSPLLQPRVLYRVFAIEEAVHERLKLSEGGALKGRLISQHLLPATKVVVILCTIGPELEQHAAQVMAEDTVASLALDGVGSAAVEALANLACSHFEGQAALDGHRTTIPLSPGMIGWSVEEGQPQIFKLLNGAEIGVTLTSSYMMLPRKSLTMVVGSGRDLEIMGSTCDYCSLRETCAYKEHYA